MFEIINTMKTTSNVSTAFAGLADGAGWLAAFAGLAGLDQWEIGMGAKKLLASAIASLAMLFAPLSNRFAWLVTSHRFRISIRFESLRFSSLIASLLETSHADRVSVLRRSK